MHFAARVVSSLSLFVLAFAGLVPAASAAPVDEGTRYLVRFAAGSDVAVKARSINAQGANVRRTFSHAVRAAVIDATPAQAEVLRRSAGVVAVEVDAPVQALATQQPAPWGLDRIDQRALPLSGSYSSDTAAAGVRAYVVDTGVRASHADFGGRVAAGWTAVTDGLGTGDCNGHGTHVAGTLAGAAYGVAKAATIVPVRVLDCAGSGSTSGVVAGLDWIAVNHAAGTPAVMNLSLGGSTSSTLDAAVQGVINDGVTAVVAAGNSGADACAASPARVPAAVTVAASDSADRQAGFSNFGSCVDLYAPGVGIRSAWHTDNTATAAMSGTSMAAPHAAGAAAVLLARTPSLTPAQVAATLASNSTVGAVALATAGTPNRLLYSPAAIAAAPVGAKAPSRPTSIRAIGNSGSASVFWTKGSDGGSPLTSQRVVIYSGTTRLGSVAVLPTVSSKKITLRPGRYYSFAVYTTNKIGNSPLSARSNSVLVKF